MGVKLKLRHSPPVDDCDENLSVSSFELDPPHASRYQKGRFRITLFPKAERFQKGRFRVTLFHRPLPEPDTSLPARNPCLATSSTAPVLSPVAALQRLSAGPGTPRSPSSACSTPTRSAKSGLRSLLCCNCSTANPDDLDLDLPPNPLSLDPLSLYPRPPTPGDLPVDPAPLFYLPHCHPLALAPAVHPTAPTPEPGCFPPLLTPPPIPMPATLAHPPQPPAALAPLPHPQPPPLSHIRSRSLNHGHPRRASLTTQLSLQPDYPVALTPPSSLPPPSPRTSYDPFDTLLHRHLPHRISLPGCSSISSLHSLYSDSEPLLLPASPTDSASSLAHAHHHRTSSSHLSSCDVPTLNRVETKGRFKVTTCITPRVPPPLAFVDASNGCAPLPHAPCLVASPAPTPTAQRKGRFLVYDSQPCGM